MPDATLLSAEHSIRVIARPDSELDWSGGAADVTYIEIVDLRTDRRLAFGNVRQIGLVPTEVLSPGVVLFADGEGLPWMWSPGSLRLRGISNVDRLRARYRHGTSEPTGAGAVTTTLARVLFDCPECGGGEKFTGRVQRDEEAGRWTAIVRCFRCDEERTRRDLRTGAIIDAYAEAFNALDDQGLFLDAFRMMRDGSSDERRALLTTPDRILPLLSASESGCRGDLLSLWAARMIDSSAWLPQPAPTCRLTEILCAAVDHRHVGCVDVVLAAAGRYTASELTSALAAAAVRCGDVGVYGTESVLAKVVAA